MYSTDASTGTGVQMPQDVIKNECQLRDQRPRKSLKAFFYNMRERFTEKIEKNSEKVRSNCITYRFFKLLEFGFFYGTPKLRWDS